MKNKSKIRMIYFVSFFIAFMAIFLALYFQITDHLFPCPLCIMQRIAYLFIILVSLIAIIHAPLSNRANIIYGIILSIITSLGLMIALRQLYLESSTISDVQSCGVGIGYLFQSMPFSDFLMLMFNGSAECGVVSWHLLGQSMAFWSMVVFLLLLILYILIVIRHIGWLIKNSKNKEGYIK